MAKKNNDIAISVKNVTKEFTVYEDKSYFLKEKIGHLGRNKKRKHVVLHDINLDIKKGQSVALIGVNGCGKSTLLKTIARINKPSAGEIFINNKNIPLYINLYIKKYLSIHNYLPIL